MDVSFCDIEKQSHSISGAVEDNQQFTNQSVRPANGLWNLNRRESFHSDDMSETSTLQPTIPDDSGNGSIRSFDSGSTIPSLLLLTIDDCLGTLSSVTYQTESQPLRRDHILPVLGLFECILTFKAGAARSFLPMLGTNNLRKGRSTVLLQHVQTLKRLRRHYDEELSTGSAVFAKSTDPPLKYSVNIDSERSFTVTRSFQRQQQPPSAGLNGMKRVLWTVTYKCARSETVSHFWLLEHRGDDWIMRALPSQNADAASIAKGGRSIFGWLKV